MYQLFLVSCSCPDGFAIRAKYQYIVGMMVFEIVYRFIIVATEGSTIDIPPGSILENVVVQGSLRLLEH
jgi:hypothetical protein